MFTEKPFLVKVHGLFPFLPDPWFFDNAEVLACKKCTTSLCAPHKVGYGGHC